MRVFILVLLCMVLNLLGNLTQQMEQYTLLPNKPVEAGVPVTFTVVSNTAGEAPFIAWDFGDENGLGEYKKGLSITHTFTQPGVYYVFARIQGEDIPLSAVQTIIKPMQRPAPTHSTTICLDTTHQKVWAVNSDNSSVALIDAKTYQLLAEVPVGKYPRTVAVDKQGNAWVTNEDDATISVVSASGQVLNTISLPYASRPYGICFDPLKNYAYVTLQGTGKLLKINASTKQIIQTAEVGRSPRGIAVVSDGSKVLVSQFISPEYKGLVREINTATMSVRKTIELAFDQQDDFEDRGRGAPNYLSSITISPDGEQAWVPSKKDNTARGMFRDGRELTFDNTVRTIVSKINMATSEEVLSSRIDINDAEMACAVEFSPYGNIAFVALQGNNRVVMIDVEYHSRLGSIDTTGLAPQGLVLNQDGTKLFVHNFMSRTVRVFNTEDIVLANNQVGTLVATIPTIKKEVLDAQVLKGKQIFYNAQDERMTFAGYISCASCHLDGGSDERVWDFTERGEGLRNTHTLLGRAGIKMGNVHWTSNFDEIQDFENDIRNGFKGKGFLPDEVFNSGTVNDPLGDKKAGLSPDLDALAAYVTSLDKVHPSPYRNQDGSLTNDAVEGKKIFAEAGCATCHAGAAFTDRISGAFHDVGTIQTSSGKRRNGTLAGFGTPTLKGIWETAPYLHDGSAPTLRDVLVTRNVDKKHGDLSVYSESELDQLVAYLLQIDESEATLTALSNSIFAHTNFLEVSPNPATDMVRLRWKEAKSIGKITIYQTNGLSLYTTQVNGLNETTVDLSNFRPGMYFVDYFDGVNKSTAKLVVR
jgi:YVTN family beta-propeller protein